VFVSHGTHNIKNSHQVDNNNQQLTIVGIHAKIEICLIIYNNINLYYWSKYDHSLTISRVVE